MASGPSYEAVFVDRDQAEADLDRNRAEHCDARSTRRAGCARRRASCRCREDRRGPRAGPDEIGEARGRAAEHAPQQAEQEQGQDRDARTRCASRRGRFLADHQLKAIKPASSQWNSRIGRSQTGCRSALANDASRCGSCRGSALQVLPSSPKRAWMARHVAGFGGGVERRRSLPERLCPWQRNRPASARFRAWRRSCRRPGRCRPGTRSGSWRRARRWSRPTSAPAARSGELDFSVRPAILNDLPICSIPSWRSCIRLSAALMRHRRGLHRAHHRPASGVVHGEHRMAVGDRQDRALRAASAPGVADSAATGEHARLRRRAG